MAEDFSERHYYIYFSLYIFDFLSVIEIILHKLSFFIWNIMAFYFFKICYVPILINVCFLSTTLVVFVLCKCL